MNFVRFGNLVPQKHDINRGTYHTAPVKFGIYAFPKGYVEPFLLSGVGRGNIQNGRWKFVKDRNGKKLYASFNELFNSFKIKNTDSTIESVEELKLEFTDEYKTLFKNINPYQFQVYQLDENGILLPTSWYLYSEEESDKKVYWVIQNKRNEFTYTGNVWTHLMYNMKPFEILRRSNEWVLVNIKTYEKALKSYISRYKFTRAKDMGAFIHTHDTSGLPLEYLDLDMIEVFIEKVE